MEEFFIILISISPLVVFLFLIVYFLGYKFKAVCKQWTIIAETHKLELIIPTGIKKTLWELWPTMTGKWDGWDISFSMESKGSRHRYYNYTTIAFKVNLSSADSFKIYSENFLSKLGKKFGTQDIEIGNPTFDNLFIIESKNESSAKKILQSDIQQKIIDFSNKSTFFGAIALENNSLTYTEYLATSSDKEREYLLFLVEEFKELAKAINQL